MKNKYSSIKVIILLIIIILIFPSTEVIGNENKSKKYNFQIDKTEIFSPGEIIDISFSNKYPTLGEPIEIIVKLKGNPIGQSYDEILYIEDEFSGLFVKSTESYWKSGNVTFDPVEIRIGRLPRYIKKISWYPVIVGNHTLKFKTGSFSERTENISVSFDSENIIFPSLGCPSIINKNTTDEITILISEERHISEQPIDISDVKLININETSTYVLDNQTMIHKTWISNGFKNVEDELIASYDIKSIPAGFYDIYVLTTKKEYRWRHAVKLINDEPEIFSFVQLTDIHIGKAYNLVNERKIASDIIEYINEEIDPDFIVMSGDLVDWGNRLFHRQFLDLQEIIIKCNSPVFTVPGNHDRYEHRLLFLYNPYYDLSSYHMYINPLNDYAFEYGDMNFLLLDSGYDYSRWEIKPDIWNLSPEGSGLTNAQLYLIENELGKPDMNQNIFMHHPAVNHEDDDGLFFVPDDLPSGNNECISFNRAEFINYCLSCNVSLVLTGHTHKNISYNYLGEEPDNPNDWPIFLQMQSSTLNRGNEGGRIIKIQDGKVISYNYESLTFDNCLFK